MAVIICDSPTGPFSVTTIPKCGSTTMRKVLAGVAAPGQYNPKTMFKAGGWHLAAPFRGECNPRSWGVLRNPWRRALSRWWEKTESPTYEHFTHTWPDYLWNIVRHRRSNRGPLTVADDQACYLSGDRPRHLVAIEGIDEWLPTLAASEGVELGPPIQARSQGNYDWRQPYRDHPLTRDIVREVFAADWRLGFDWEDPLE